MDFILNYFPENCYPLHPTTSILLNHDFKVVTEQDGILSWHAAVFEPVLATLTAYFDEKLEFSIQSECIEEGVLDGGEVA